MLLRPTKRVREEQYRRELELSETLVCRYNRTLAQVIEKTLLAGVLVVLGEAMPLSFHGDATFRGHK